MARPTGRGRIHNGECVSACVGPDLRRDDVEGKLASLNANKWSGCFLAQLRRFSGRRASGPPECHWREQVAYELGPITAPIRLKSFLRRSPGSVQVI